MWWSLRERGYARAGCGLSRRFDSEEGYGRFVFILIFFLLSFFLFIFFLLRGKSIERGGGYGQLAEDLVDCWLITGCVGGAGVVAVPGPVWAWVVSYCGLGLGVAVGVWKIVSFYGFLEALRVGRAYELWQ